MEKLATFERDESPEHKLATLLKEKGLEDPEAKDFLIKWTREQEKQVEESSDPEASIQFELKRARLFLEAGLEEYAFESFEDAKTLAWNLHKDELYNVIEKEMDEAKKSK